MGAYPATLNAITATTSYSPTPAIKPAAATIESPLSVHEVSALDLWLEKLAYKESHNRDNVKILDVNGRFSYGCLQFQEWTFRTFGEKYGLVKAGVSLEPLIYNCALQKQIAKRMIQNDYKMWQSWYTSVMEKDLGLPPRE